MRHVKHMIKRYPALPWKLSNTAHVVKLFIICMMISGSYYAAAYDTPMRAEADAEIRRPEIQVRLTPLEYKLPLCYAQTVIHYCDETGVPVWLASRMFDRESSGWDRYAVSWVGAQGLAQIMPDNLEEFARLYNDGAVIDPFDAETAIGVGTRHLADLYSRLNTWRGAIAAYNCGIGRYRSGVLPWETINHVRIIMGKEL